jgi:hypothetical protein
MVLAELRDLIRAEAGIEGDDTYQVLVDAIINQEYGRLTGKSKYEELKKVEVFTTVANAEFEFTLPTDFQLFGSLIYLPIGELPEEGIILDKGTYPRAGIRWQGNPKYWYRSGMELLVYPYSDSLIGDTLTLEYHKKQILTNNSDILLVNSLEPAILLSSIARLVKMKDTRKGQIIAQDAQRAFLDARTENAGN